MHQHILQIEPPSAALSAEWDAYVATKPDATCHHLSAWALIAERAYGLPSRLIVARDDDGGFVRSGGTGGARPSSASASPRSPLRGALSVVSVPRPLGRYVTTGLFGAYGAILADNEAIARDLLEAARHYTHVDGARYLHVKSFGDGPTPRGFQRHDVWATALLSLEGGTEKVWARFKSSIHSAVRQAMRANVVVHSGRSELDAFYEVLADNMHRKGAPIYGTHFMRSLFDALGSKGVDVITLRKDGVAISGAMTIALGDVMYIPLIASSRASHRHLRPNNLLYWRIIERACAAGLRVLDFGTSLRGSSALAFKRGWGAAIEPVPSYVYTTDGDAKESPKPTLTADSLVGRAGMALLKRLPRQITDALGPRICRVIV